MRIIAHDSSRVTLLFPVEEVSPLGGASWPNILDAITEHYSFVKSPDLSLPRHELEKIGYKFEIGKIAKDGDNVNVGDLSIFGDGIVVSALTTDDAEVFIDDLIAYMKAVHKFRDFNTKPVRRFISQIVVEFEKPLSSLIESYNMIGNVISSKLESIYEAKIPLGLARLEFQFDKVTEQSSRMVPNFIIERRVGVSFSKERYYCSAPLRTRDHLETLAQIESALR